MTTPLAQVSGGTFSRNVLANTAGRIWSVLSNLVFVPIYLTHLGSEAYGLVVFYATLFATIAALDAGLGSILTRQVALSHRRNELNDAGDSGSTVDLARTVEVLLVVVAFVISASVFFGATWITDHWLKIQLGYRTDTILAVRLMGLIVAVQWPAIAYQGALVGLEQQVRLNVARTLFSFAQAIVAATMVVFTKQGIVGYFLAILVFQSCCTLVLRQLMWRGLKRQSVFRGRFSLQEVALRWRFGLGMAVIAALSALLTQTDKLVMSKEASLADFSDYGVASTICALLGMLGYPVFTAALPRLTKASSGLDPLALEATYLLSCEIIAAVAVPAWAMLTYFSHDLMAVWIGSNASGPRIARIIPLLSTGYLINVLVVMPYALQVASGWTSLSIKKNILTALVSVPLLLILIPRWGAIGAALVWAGINIGYLMFEVPIVHKVVFGSIKPLWWLQIVVLPMGIASAIALALRAVLPVFHTVPIQLIVLMGEAAALVVFVSLSLNAIRSGVLEIVRRRRLVI